MKKILTLLPLLCFFYSNSNSQITLTPVCNPAPGDIGKYFYCDTTGILPGTYFLYTTNLNNLSNNTEDFGGMMTEIVIN